jgi:hypothetical protein
MPQQAKGGRKAGAGPEGSPSRVTGRGKTGSKKAAKRAAARTRSIKNSVSSKDLAAAITGFKPGFERGHLASIRDIKENLRGKFSKAAIDKALIRMAESGKYVLHEHDHPAGAGREARKYMLKYKGAYYVGIAKR